ncbi:hypothetical protein [Frankia casuarinae]|jgi:hypothetical protein|uniref:Uncharacterized protein n=1 Tax=Frankia casuarinae (strain DSM 45818 / CECT 9043 / HFP020203 / CcI3) TaxID=106370 RepID=Q2J814_FRACC|nr:hypothetical protein [Frankia casuarinae]ABD12578.1 hypothetical protein Francci3_3221 [Frankia casuarinae]
MRIRPSVILALGLGYVLGARAGREHYDAIMRQVRDLQERPEVQSVAGLVSAQAATVYQKARDLLGAHAGQSATRLFAPLGSHSSNGVGSNGVGSNGVGSNGVGSNGVGSVGAR